MAVDILEIKQNIKDGFEELQLIDLQGEVDSKGNYIYLSGLKTLNAVELDIEFTVLIAGVSFCGSNDSLEETLAVLSSEILSVRVSNGFNDLTISSVRVVKKNSLYIYECKLNVEVR